MSSSWKTSVSVLQGDAAASPPDSPSNTSLLSSSSSSSSPSQSGMTTTPLTSPEVTVAHSDTASSQYPSLHPPSSPPPLNHARSLYARIPLPAMDDEDVELNHLLQPGSMPHILYDIRSTTASARCISRFWNVDDHGGWRDEAATNPPVNHLIIETPLLDRMVLGSASNGYFVTINDVLRGVHRAVHDTNESMLGLDSALDTSGFGLASSLLFSAPRDGQGSGFCDCDQDIIMITAHAAGEVEEDSNQGWQWVGLELSPTENGVWILLLE